MTRGVFQMEQACTPSLSSMQLGVDTLSVFSLCEAGWSSGPLTSAATLTPRQAMHKYTFTRFTNLLWINFLCMYFSCGSFQDDEVFAFSFNLVTNHEGKEVTYALNKTCSPSRPWAPREVTCEENYMEVSLDT